ncbi:MAG TPA: MFS transporter [Gammaproteobacteria bacterium]|nr:MFS transporter [Gammaproteobacteria bacterium]
MPVSPIKEKSAIAALASLYALRMLGLFLIYPVLAIYAQQMPHSTPFLIGLTMGVYGLSQAVLQIPFGMLSDKFGRKPLIIIGLVLFALGSIVAALSTDIYGLIFGRLLQGMGAISAVITALLSDLLAPQRRAKAMAMVGMTIGMSFGLSLILAPALGAWFGLSGLFWLIVVLNIIAIGVLIYAVPTPAHSKVALPKGQWREIFAQKQLWQLNISIFFLHALLTTLFVWMPAQLNHLASHWYQQSIIYLVLLIASYAVMMPVLIYAEKKYRQKQVLQGSVLIFSGVLLYFAFMPNTLFHLVLSLFLFLIPFNLLEATLPAWVSRIVPQQSRGAALGLYATAQFLGIFVGGVGSGLLLKYFSLPIVLFSNVGLMLIWWLLMLGLKPLSPAHNE